MNVEKNIDSAGKEIFPLPPNAREKELLDMVPAMIAIKRSCRQGEQIVFTYISANKGTENFFKEVKEKKGIESVIGYTDFDLMEVEEESTTCYSSDLQAVMSPGEVVFSEERVGGEYYEVRKKAIPLQDDSGDFEILSVINKSLWRDSLTGLFNKKYFLEKLNELVHQEEGNQVPFGILMIDADNFKKINDTLGHEFGDLVLIAMGKLIKNGTRHQNQIDEENKTPRIDTVARCGGDEFSAILPECSKQFLYKVKSRINSLIKNDLVKVVNQQIEDLEKKGLISPNFYDSGVVRQLISNLTLSIGLLHSGDLTSGDIRTIETLCSIVDRAMYEEKTHHKKLATQNGDNEDIFYY